MLGTKSAKNKVFILLLQPIEVNGGYNSESLCLGHVIAIAELVDCLKIDSDGLYQVKRVNNITQMSIYKAPLPDGQEIAFGDYPPGRWAWMLETISFLQKIQDK